MINFIIPIEPVGQMRPRRSMHGGMFKAEKQRSREYEFMLLAKKFKPKKLIEGAIKLTVKCYFKIPKSYSLKKKEEAKSGQLSYIKTPDLDNCLKFIKDCLTQLKFWQDDRQVNSYGLGTGKYYDDGQGERWEVIIEEIPYQKTIKNCEIKISLIKECFQNNNKKQ